ncbi:hypothetical protein NG895_14840 [Aeoliella sp. ICT_H6.2]|uniref:Beta-lactamase regulating signal transducer with metallopeptidase domain n=1 Tax=Aeoliella straminimaris TaxID=2954799 RepID=A0A9X2FGE7_9BACT|nr:M56 family metallopeptidase [Aeoliella straminimaris]MCO6045186.1 hypothetical protein [Aeoliella straminimaris]
MIEVMQEFVASSFYLALLAAVVAAPVAVLALTIDLLLGGRMAARFRCWLWIVVAARLLLPFAPGSPVSLQNVLAAFQNTSPSPAAGDLHAIKAPAPRLQQTWSTPIAGSAAQTPQPDSVSFISAIDWGTILIGAVLAVWLTGVLWVLLRAGIACVRFQRHLKLLPSVDDPAIIETVQRACRDIGVRAPIIKRVADLPGPALFGWRFPTLCLPEGEHFSNGQLRMIALHEAMHIRRNDGLLAWLLTAVRAAHWCNPIAWLAVVRVERYREQACDEAVRQHTDADQQGEYAELLLRFAAGRPVATNLGLLGLWFARPARRLSQRIEAFRGGARSSRLPWLLSTTTVVAVAFVGLTDAMGSSHDRETPPQANRVPMPGKAGAPSFTDKNVAIFGVADEPNPTEERTYDLTAALEKADRIPAGMDPRRWLLTYTTLGSGHGFPITQSGKTNPNQVTISMSRRQHDFFAHVLSDIERFGHTFQICIDTRVFPSESIENIPSIDWQKAVQFAAPDHISASKWDSDSSAEPGKTSVAVEAVSFEFAPFVVCSISDTDMQRVEQHFQRQPHAAVVSAPKVTLFSGQLATICDQSQTPFVTSVNYGQGEQAAAAQPNITVIDQGLRIDMQPKMLDLDHLELRCHLTLSTIDAVREVKLPGADITVQSPKVTRQTIATTCRMKRGESLLIASLGEKTQYYAITPQWLADPIEVDP